MSGISPEDITSTCPHCGIVGDLEGHTCVPKLKWWGYRHTNGTIQVKRYFDDRDLREADESPFCARVTVPFDAVDRDDAIKQATAILK